MEEKNMDKLDNLSSVASEMLDGLKADPSLLRKAKEQAVKGRGFSLRSASFIPAICCAAVLICCVAFLPGLIRGQKDVPNAAVLTDAAYESSTAFESGLVAQESSEYEESAIMSYAAGSSSAPQESLRGALLDLSRTGSSSLASGSSSPAYQNLWIPGSDGVFPMIRIDGKYYRQLSSGISSKLLGRKIGPVELYTTEPALEDGSSILSNVVPVGNDVYQISGMDGTLVAADTGSGLYAFQRVSFNGQSVKKGEGLSSVLNIKGHAVSLSLSGVGTVTDADEADRLIGVLLKKGVRESSGSLNAKQSLLITLDNGIVIQMIVKDEKLSSCGVWSCPEFFDAFNKAIR